MTFDELLDKRLNRVYRGESTMQKGEFGPQWYGFMGMNDGEQLNSALNQIFPSDWRWTMSQAEELEDVDLDRLVFGKLNDGPLSNENEVRFILRSGRLLALIYCCSRLYWLSMRSHGRCRPYPMGYGFRPRNEFAQFTCLGQSTRYCVI